MVLPKPSKSGRFRTWWFGSPAEAPAIMEVERFYCNVPHLVYIASVQEEGVLWDSETWEFVYFDTPSEALAEIERRRGSRL